MITLYLAAALLSRSARPNHQTPVDSTYRWLLIQSDLNRAGDTEKAIKTLNLAATAGYNGAVFQEAGLEASRTVTPSYNAALQSVVNEARRLNIDLIPSVAPIGNAESVLAQDPSLVESMPYHSVRYVVLNGIFKAADPPLPIINGGFDAFAGDLPTGFKGTHGTDIVVAQDTAMKHGGASALRVDGQPTSKPGQGGVTYQQPLVLQQWHQYRISLWTKGAAAVGAAVNLAVVGSSGPPIANLEWQNTTDWVRNDVVFDSQANNAVTLSILIQAVPGAKIWLDDLTLEDVGMLNITRRSDCPVTIKGDDGVIYNEGVDITGLQDPFKPAGMSPGHFDISHPAPLPALTPISRIHEGQSVLVDYYAASVVAGQVSICPNERKTQAIMKAEIQRIVDLTHPRYIMLNISNVRTMGWDPGCDATGLTGGEIIAKFVKEEASLIRGIDNTIQIATYSDMFDPAHNCLDQFFLVKGGAAGSITGLPKDALIVNWNFQHAPESLSYFSRLGFKQVLWGFFDNANKVIPIADWEKVAGGVSGVKGFGYVTRYDDYTHLNEFKAAATGIVH